MNKQQYLEEIDKVIAQGPYKDTWESLEKHETPEWFKNAKFGIFIHWGIYSMLGQGEWVFIRCRHTGVNGIPEICISRVRLNLNTM